MKNSIHILLLAFMVTSCSDSFLDLPPESTVTSGNFYKTEAQFQQALVGTYEATRGVFGSPASWVMGEMRSDNTHFEFNGLNRGVGNIQREDTDYFLDDNTSEYVTSKYNSNYIGIARANAILDQIPAASMNALTTNAIVGQAKFLRALFYFNLVRYFGGVPLYLTSVKGATDAYIDRSSVAEVYQAIITDLTEAKELLPEPVFPQNGRANKGTVRLLLADVYSTRKEYALAEKQLKELLTVGYQLLPDYAEVYKTANKNSVESIFEIQYQQGNQGQNSNFSYSFLPLSADISKVTGITSQNYSAGGWNVPTWEMINSYEKGDERLDASIGIAEGSGDVGAMVIQTIKSPVNYMHPTGKRAYPFIKKFLNPHALQSNMDDNFPVYRYADVLLLLSESLNEQNRSQEALPYLNQIRKRAGLPLIENQNKEALREIIFHERRIEFAFENKRWLDLVRTGKAIEVMTKNGEYIKSLYPNISAKSYNITPDRLLFPIPHREVLIGNLMQNPGY